MKVLLLVLAILLAGCSVVGPGSRGIRVSLGKVDSTPLESGPHLWFPFLYGMTTLNVQVQKAETETSAASKDMQEIHTIIAVNWSVSADKVVEVYRTVGSEDDILNRIIAPAVSEVLKAEMAKLTAEEILIRRLELKKSIDDNLKTRLAHYGVNMFDLSIVNLQFSREFTQAIEHKQIAEQKAKQAEYDAQRAVKEAAAAVNHARGQAESQKLVQTSLTPAILQQQAIQKWNGQFPQVMGNGALPFLNITTKTSTGE